MPGSIHQKFWLSLLFLGWLITGHATDLAAQRKLFTAAQTAFQQNKLEQYNALKTQLTHYPLYPYLVYAELVKQLPDADEQAIQQFLDDYADTPLAAKLRNQWLFVLAQREDWAGVLTHYAPTADREIQCVQRQALQQVGQTAAAFNHLESLWLTGRTLPASCNTLFAAWQQAEALPARLIWQRLSLAIETKNEGLIKQLTALLAPPEQQHVALWQKIYLQPQLLAKANLAMNTPFTTFMAAHCFNRLVEKDPHQAMELWENQVKLYPFTAQQRGNLMRKIALGLAAAGLPQAAEWLQRIPHSFIDQTVIEWRIRLALQTQDWQHILQQINRLPEKERTQPQTRYWLARAHEELGNDTLAISIYQSLAGKTDYYGFLASNRIGKPISKPAKQAALVQQQLAELQQCPAVQRAFELYQLSLLPEAREEWQGFLKHLKPDEIYAAAYIATRWGWYERAISTVAQTNYTDDLTLRFPLAYRDQVQLQAKSYNLDPAWIFAVIRQESAFMADARSHVGALGLMQLMPGTAQFVARQLKQKIMHTYEVLEINLNLRLGSHYLKQLLDTYQGNVVLATAAYNAGPGRVHKWLMQRPALISDIWVETIPWKETRHYVKNILAFQTIYQLQLGEKPNLGFMRETIVPIS